MCKWHSLQPLTPARICFPFALNIDLNSVKVKSNKGFYHERLAFFRIRIVAVAPKAFAHGLGVSRKDYLAIEEGRAPITAELMARLVRVYQLNVDWLLTGEGKPRRSVGNSEIHIHQSAGEMKGQGRQVVQLGGEWEDRVRELEEEIKWLKEELRKMNAEIKKLDK